MIRFPIAELDLGTGLLRVETTDGVGFTERLDGYKERTELRRIRVDVSAQQLEVDLPDGSTVMVDTGTDDELPTKRAVVYLDQNYWSAVAAWSAGTGRVKAEDAKAAELLWGLSEEGQLILPLSAAHLLETGALYGQRRQEHACASLRLSRGWLMRSPAKVYREELETAQAGNPGPASYVFTTRIRDVFAGDVRSPALSGMPPEVERFLSHTTSVLALFDTLLEPDALPDTGGKRAVEAYGVSETEAASQLRAEGASREVAEKVAHGRLLMDLVRDIRELWPTREALDTWLPRSVSDVSMMPYLSRLRAVLFSRMRNNSSWSGSDFNDVHYLSCAAAYADFVGERRTIADLRACKGVPSGARLTSRLPEAIEMLPEVLAASV